MKGRVWTELNWNLKTVFLSHITSCNFAQFVARRHVCVCLFVHERIHTHAHTHSYPTQSKKPHVASETSTCKDRTTHTLDHTNFSHMTDSASACILLLTPCMSTSTDACIEQIPHCIVRPLILNHLQAKFSPKLSSFCLTETWFKLEPFKFFHYSPVSTQACQTDSMIHTPLTLIVFGRNFCSGWHSAAHAWGWLSGSVCACGAPPTPHTYKHHSCLMKTTSDLSHLQKKNNLKNVTLLFFNNI